jgi:uncharacterized protein YdeI (YjbR/CyaY-like superfamily)
MPAAATTHSPKVDAYIAKAAPFAQPILTHLRALMHAAAPGVTEEIKWSRPFFVYNGVILGNLSAFKAHCSFGLWGQETAQQLRADGVASAEGMGSFGKITALGDLPGDRQLRAYIKAAASRIATGERTRSIVRPQVRVAKAEPVIPPELAAALKASKATDRFAAMSPSCRREYCDWIAQAKREETRLKRAATAAEWIAAGKGRNWQYEAR